MSQIVHRVDSLICTPTNSNHLWSHWRTTMALHHSRLGLENKSGRIFLRLRSLFYKILPSNLGVFIPFRHHIWGETILCFYHTDLGQNAVFHNFPIQIALIQYSGRSKHAWAFSETVKKISKITYTASRFSLLTSAKVDCLN